MFSEWTDFRKAQLRQIQDGNVGDIHRDMPFEAHAVEAIFATVCTLHSQDVKAIDSEAQLTLQCFKVVIYRV